MAAAMLAFSTSSRGPQAKVAGTLHPPILSHVNQVDSTAEGTRLPPGWQGWLAITHLHSVETRGPSQASLVTHTAFWITIQTATAPVTSWASDTT